MTFDKKLVVRVYKNSNNIRDILNQFIDEDSNVELSKEEKVDSQYQDFVIKRTLNSRIRSKIKEQPGMTVLVERDVE